MPKYQFPPPQNWQDFEDLCWDLWKSVWGDAHIRKNGRQGQPQHGVDVFGQPDGPGAEYAGIQCKLKDQLSGGQLTAKEMATELRKAKKFNPNLSQLIFATTAPSDQEAQEAARALNTKKLAVSIASWNDIELLLEEHEEVARRRFAEFFVETPAPSPDEGPRRAYLRQLWGKLLPVPLLGVAHDAGQSVPLSAVYTALDTRHSLHLDKTAQGWQITEPRGSERPELVPVYAQLLREAEARAEQHGDHIEAHARLLTAVEAASVWPRLVLLGPAGSGKSTFGRHLALCFAGEALNESRANLDQLGSEGYRPWPHEGVLPLFVELRRFVASKHFPSTGAECEASQLEDFLLAEAGSDLTRGLLLDELATGALVILDGLDETPATGSARGRLRQVVEAFALCHEQSRILVTSRPYAYQTGDAWRLDGAGFESAELAPFDDNKISLYVRSWYRFLAGREQLDAEQAAVQADNLLAQIGDRGSTGRYLRPLAERPLMLGMMADLHAHGGGRLPGGRAGLYEKSVDLLLDRWNDVRGLGREAAEELRGLDVVKIRTALERLAFEIHRDRGGAESEEAAQITADELRQALYREAGREVSLDERRERDFLHQRSGILVADSDEVYRFAHRSFQEYLAACYLTRHEFPDLLDEVVTESAELWREVVPLAAGKLADTPFAVWALLAALVPREPPRRVRDSDPRYFRAHLAGVAMVENQLLEPASRYAEKLEDIRLWLEQTLVAGALSPVDRAGVGRLLGRLGDHRPYIGLDGEGPPDIGWCEVAGGSYEVGSKEKTPWSRPLEPRQVDLEAFALSIYPVTVEQFGAFVVAGGYGERRFWSQEGWEEKADHTGPKDYGDDFQLPNHPRVGIGFWEAEAFCRWLSKETGHLIRLPTEEEWEAAARGQEGRAYPWGDEFEEDRCNSGESGIGLPSAVGMFPRGKSQACGALDLAGNVWEWTVSTMGTSRVIRGGSWGSGARLVRAASRYRGRPSDRGQGLGFRLARGQVLRSSK